MKEYMVEGGEPVDINQLRAPKMRFDDYMKANASLPIVCHDILVDVENSVLLLNRCIYPAKGELWPIGGRVLKGVPMEESLQMKVKEESNLELSDIAYLGVARTYWKTDPFGNGKPQGHGQGVDTINFMFYGKGKGQLKFDDTSAFGQFVPRHDYTPEFRQTLHPYVQDMMDLAMPFVKHIDGHVEKPVPKTF